MVRKLSSRNSDDKQTGRELTVENIHAAILHIYCVNNFSYKEFECRAVYLIGNTSFKFLKLNTEEKNVDEKNSNIDTNRRSDSARSTGKYFK